MADFTMVRGDTKVLALTAYKDDEPIELSDGDVLHFRLFDENGDVIISKDATADDQDADSYEISITLDAADTQNMEMEKEQTYRWEAEIVFSDGTVLTPFYNKSAVIKPDKIVPELRGES